MTGSLETDSNQPTDTTSSRSAYSKIGIAGLGEIGSSFLRRIVQAKTEYETPKLSDPKLGLNQSLGQCDLIHVCVPADKVHLVVLSKEILYLVHSTVKVGTCMGLISRGFKVVHAPVRGMHPNLFESLGKFKMPLGGEAEHTRPAADYLWTLGIHATLWGRPQNTELAKILSTTRLGLDVAFMRWVYDLCKTYGCDPSLVYRQWTRDYNKGYEDMGAHHLARPVLNPSPGPLGGHCVGPNAQLLENQVGSNWVTRAVLNEARDWRP